MQINKLEKRQEMLLVFLASKLSNFIPAQNLNAAIKELKNSQPGLYAFLKEDRKYFLVVELVTEEIIPGIALESYEIFLDRMEKVNLKNYRTALVVNLEKIFVEFEKLVVAEGK